MAILTEYDGSVNDTFNFGVGVKRAQGFKIATGKKITGFSIKGSKGNTTPCTSFTASIYAGGADPTAGTLIKSESFSSDGLGAYTASPSFRDFTFSTPATGLAGGSTQYYLVLFPDDGTGGDVIRWSVDNTSPSYADGSNWQYVSSWSQRTTEDCNFKIYGDDDTPAGPAHVKKICGIAFANIKKINGIAIANVKKINSIT